VETAEASTVAVVIPCFGQAQFLAAAIESTLDQSQPAAEIIVVDDGDEDDLSQIVGRYSGVRLVRQQNRGLAAARNLGLHDAGSEKIIFLDADDRLLPSAIRAGLDCFREHPEAAFIYGPFQEMVSGRTLSRFTRMNDRLDLVQCNWVAMIGAVMFDREKLQSCGGFDESLGMCEDWDAYLRLSRDHCFASHNQTVAVYRKHDTSMSADVRALRSWIEVVRERERTRGLDERELQAWHEGERVWDFYYGPKGGASVAYRARRKLSRLLADR
jgi:glycosyltransferase involved in cell wall biosynthesis